MDTDTLDEVPAPHFEDRLWDELAALHELQLRQDARRPQAQLNRPRWHRPGWRTVGIGMVSLAAAALAVAALAVRPSGPERDDGVILEPLTPTPTPDAAAPNADQPVTLEARIVAATDEAVANSVVHVFQDSTTGFDSEMWTDEQSGAFRSLGLDANGQPSFDSGPATPPTLDQQAPPVPSGSASDAASGVDPTSPADPEIPLVTDRTVDYCFSEYTELDAGALPASNEAERIRDGLESGAYVVDGTEPLDGRDMIRVIQAEDLGEGWVWLVDPETYRPMQLTGYPGTEFEYVMHFEYLPRTPENLALLSPPIPDGFVQVDDLHGDRERFDAGCT